MARLAPYTLGEAITGPKVMGTGLVFAGAVSAPMFGPHQKPPAPRTAVSLAPLCTALHPGDDVFFAAEVSQSQLPWASWHEKRGGCYEVGVGMELREKKAKRERGEYKNSIRIVISYKT